MNNSLPALPLIDGALWIDNSTLEDLQACPRLLEYKFIRRRSPAGDKPALNFGLATHKWLSYRYSQAAEDPTECQLDTMEQMLQAHFDENPQPPDEWRTLDLGVKLMRRYNEVHMVEPWEVIQTESGPFVEFPFAFKLFDVVCDSLESILIPVYYTGRIDLGVIMEGDPFIVDHKTTSMLGPSFFEDMGMSAQQRGYCWAYRKATGKPPRGYLINAIRGRRPAQDQARSKKKIVEDDDFQRERFYIDNDAIDEWEDNVKLLINELVYHHSRGAMPMKTKWCVGKYGRCAYYDVCSLPKGNRPAMLESHLFEENKWSPLNDVKI